MEKCDKCTNGTKQDAKYICREKDYSVVDLDGKLLKLIGEHDLPDNDHEIGSFTNVYYCSCGKYWNN